MASALVKLGDFYFIVHKTKKEFMESQLKLFYKSFIVYLLTWQLKLWPELLRNIVHPNQRHPDKSMQKNSVKIADFLDFYDFSYRSLVRQEVFDIEFFQDSLKTEFRDKSVFIWVQYMHHNPFRRMISFLHCPHPAVI